MMDKCKQDRAMFLSFCIEQYAKAKVMTTESVVDCFEKYGIDEHYCEFYDPLHTMGTQWIIADIDEMIETRRRYENE